MAESQKQKKRKRLRVGDSTESYCGGAFGRDGYGYKEVIATGKHRGRRWVLVQVGEAHSKSQWLAALTGRDLQIAIDDWDADDYLN